MHIIKFFLSILFFLTLFSAASSATTWDSAYIQTFVKKSLESMIPAPSGGRITFRCNGYRSKNNNKTLPSAY